MGLLDRLFGREGKKERPPLPAVRPKVESTSGASDVERASPTVAPKPRNRGGPPRSPGTKTRVAASPAPRPNPKAPPYQQRHNGASSGTVGPKRFQPTGEQVAIVDAFRSGAQLVIQAGAGTGKTSTLRLLGEANPQRSGIYIAYNRAIANDARASFPKNVSCSTAHSLAWKPVGAKYQHRLNGPRLPARVVAEILDITQPVRLDRFVDVSPDKLALAAVATVRNFSNSDDSEIKPQHVSRVAASSVEGQQAFAAAVIPLARKVWDDIQDVRGRLRFEHDHYLKMWALRNPKLPCDFVLLDEAQDANPVIAGVFNQQTHAQRVLVGDSSQAIYGWRGAVNSMATFQGERLQLSQSFRFGHAIASEANKWLSYLRADLRLSGYHEIRSRIAPLSAPKAILCRTNAGAVREVMRGLDERRRVALVGGGDAIKALAFAARDLQEGRVTDHPELFMFDSWADVREHASEEAGSDLNVFVRLIDDLGWQAVVGAMDDLVDERYADVVVSTGHKAKGREWETVRIAQDFRAPKDDEKLPVEEAMLAYVSVTRAKLTLDRGGLSFVDQLT